MIDLIYSIISEPFHFGPVDLDLRLGLPGQAGGVADDPNLPDNNQEERKVQRFKEFLCRMQKKAKNLLRRLHYDLNSPEADEDIRRVVDIFTTDQDHDRFEETLRGLSDPKSEVAEAFLKDWDEFILILKVTPVRR